MVSVLFHSPHGVLFTFPSRYLFTIGRQKYSALEGGPPRFRQDFTCPVVLKSTVQSQQSFVYWTITVYGAAFQLLGLDGWFLTLWNLGGDSILCLTTPPEHEAPAREVQEV